MIKMKKCDEKETAKNDDQAITSKSVVKFSAAQTPENFTILQFNTNLNYPPSNWLNTSASSFGLQNAVSQSIGFSSFHMAHMFPDSIGDVDVISDAENIKKLLKLPYSHGSISMMVHRVGNTLLIDDFNVYKHLLLTAETEWTWIKKFFSEHIRKSITKKDIIRYLYDKSREVLQKKSLNSKFLYYSLLEADNSKELEQNSKLQSSSRAKKCEHLLPEPNYHEQVPDSESNHNYNRNIIWNFENLQMLLGTNLPIFGGNSHPCISLKLRDMNTPINVLTGIDYWLDNLMSNAPEVMMCYHLDGIVQKYEIIKTEELPNFEESKFSPKVVHDLAKNILAFLKTNATKAGHTYWLFKSNDDDIVKLYDLTCLCAPIDKDRTENPFTVPVAMLLYRVARNMKYSHDQNTKTGTIKMLLENSIALLSMKKYPEIIASSYFMLADIFIPSETDPRSPKLLRIDDLQKEHCDCPTSQLNLNTDTYSWTKENTKNLKKSHIDVENESSAVRDRCESALKCIRNGFECLETMAGKENTNKCDNSNVAKSSEKIPMKYETLNSNKNLVKLNTEKEIILKSFKSYSKNAPEMQTWNTHLNKLFVEKMCLVYEVLAENDFYCAQYGHCLKHLCFCKFFKENMHSMTSPNRNSSGPGGQRLAMLLGRIADCFFMIVNSWKQLDDFRTDFKTLSNIDSFTKMRFHIEPNTDHDLNLISDAMSSTLKDDSIENFLLISHSFYEKALKCPKISDTVDLRKRYGNILNELGSFFISKLETFDDSFEKNFEKAKSYISDGIETFEKINDFENVALLHANLARLMKIKATIYTKETDFDLKKQLKYLKMASLHYKEAQAYLDRRNSPAYSRVRATISHDLSTTMSNLAFIVYESPEFSEQQVIDAFKEALDYCLPANVFNAAVIHRRLAEFYCRKYNIDTFNDFKDANFHLIELNFDKAFGEFLQLNEFGHCLDVAVKKLDFCVSLIEKTTTNKVRNHEKLLTKVIDYAMKMKVLSSDCENNANAKSIEQFIDKCLAIVQSLLKIYKKRSNMDSTRKFEIVKKKYEHLLKMAHNNKPNCDLIFLKSFVCDLSELNCCTDS